MFLPTAIVQVQDKFGAYYTCRALLDSASQSNFISEQLCQILKLEREEENMPVLLLEGNATSVSESVSESVSTTIKSRLNEYSANLKFSILSSITGNLPSSSVNIADWKIPNRVKLADPNFNVPNKFDMLIGAKLFFKLFSIGEVELSPSLPSLKNTVFGWILAGEAIEESSKTSCDNKSYSCHAYSSPVMNNQITTIPTIKFDSKQQPSHVKQHFPTNNQVSEATNIKSSITERRLYQPNLPDNKNKSVINCDHQVKKFDSQSQLLVPFGKYCNQFKPNDIENRLQGNQLINKQLCHRWKWKSNYGNSTKGNIQPSYCDVNNKDMLHNLK